MVYERGLAGDLAKLLDRIARAAAALVAAGREEQADKVVDAYEAGLLRVFNARLETTAVASAELVIEELTGEKALPGAFETKFISLFEVAQAAIRLWLASYGADKVTSILDTTRKIIRRALLRGHEQNEPPRVLAKRIREETGGEIGRRRAVTIARTETGVAASVGADAAAEATGLQLDKEWVSTHDARVRPDHAEADGQRVRMEHSFTVGGVAMRYPRDPKGPANQVINCFPAETSVKAMPRAATRHWYEGELIEIVTARGNKLAGTPNHPILTASGWQPLNKVAKGDCVISCVDAQIEVLPDPNVNHVNTSIGEVFDALHNSRDLERVARGDVDFHGDRPSHDVDVVFVDGELRDGLDPFSGKHGREFGLKHSDTGEPDFVSLGLARHLDSGNAFGAPGFIGGDGERGSSFGRSIGHPHSHRLGSATTAHADIDEALMYFGAVGSKLGRDSLHRQTARELGDDIIADGIASVSPSQRTGLTACSNGAGSSNVEINGPRTNAAQLSDFVEGLSGNVISDEVLSVSIRQVACHVFNLEDVRGWYIAEGIVAHNCRCQAIYHPRLPRR